jgi:hypothetical protein
MILSRDKDARIKAVIQMVETASVSKRIRAVRGWKYVQSVQHFLKPSPSQNTDDFSGHNTEGSFVSIWKQRKVSQPQLRMEPDANRCRLPYTPASLQRLKPFTTTTTTVYLGYEALRWNFIVIIALIIRDHYSWTFSNEARRSTYVWKATSSPSWK